MKSLQQELSEAKDRVAELEAELSKAQTTIEQMNNNATVIAQDTEQPGQAKDQTVRGEPLYDAYNPQKPVAQQDVITEKFTPELQRQAVATTRLIADDLERSRIRNITRIADQVPNMQYGQSGNEARISIRGMRTNRTGAEADPVVAIFEDGISVPTTTQALEPYVDVNRIEVLRGPQGVMYGRNAFGGVINIISNEPDPSGWDAAFEGEYGYADGTRFDAMLNVPILETLSTRIAARYDMHSGYVGNFVLDGDADDLRDRKQQYVRMMTKWEPSDKFNLMVNLISYDQNQTGSGMWGYQQIGAYVDGEYQTGNLIAPEGARADRDGWNVGRNMASLEDQENLSGTIKLNWDIGFANLEWFINKSTFENQQVFDSDYSDAGDPYNSDFNGWRSKRDTWSSELRLLSNSNGRFDWLAGVYWLDMESRWDWLETRHAEFFKPEWDLEGRYKTDNTSIFASAGYNFNDSWRLSGGLRWYKDNKTLRNGEKDSWDGVLWNAALNYKINENMDSYFSASTGYRPGGLNETPGVEASFDSESVTAYELGLKSILRDGSLVLNLSAFYNDFSDMQAQSFTILPLPGTAGLMDYMSTAGDMESKGVEAEIQWLPGTRWNISANVAWLDAKFKDYEVPNLAGLGHIEGHTMGDTLNLDGWRPALSPEWSFGLQASYIFDVGKGGTLTPMIQTIYVGEQYTNDLNLVGARQDSYTKTDIRLFWDLPGNKIKFQFYLENIEEEANVNNTVIYNPEERPEVATFLANWGDLMTYGILMSYKW
ncbi:MAG: TonB-dependent receptor [Xanthomonadales bacterium]|nr:TonB-dependent receptor [Xanthomonadales bacterium]